MKKLFVFTLLFIAFFYGNAQNNDYYNRMQHIFGNINKTKVTTGYLKEFGIRLTEVEAYYGTLSSNNFVDKTQWQSLYSSLYTMRVGTVAQSMTAPDIVSSNLKSQQDGTSDVLLTALYYNYQQYKTNAYTNGDVTVSNDRIYDVSGRNPYDTKKVFAVTPLKNHLKGSTFSFKLPSSLIYTNTGLTLNQVQIDFGNGQGYQTVTLNTVKNITYSSGGEKKIKVKFVYSGGPTLYSHSKIWLDYIDPNQGQQARFDGSDTTTHVITGDAWNGSSASGLITVELAPGHTELTKPLIVVEGFDPDGSFDYSDLINENNPGGLLINIGGTTLNQAIEDEDYDLVFVDFVNGTDYIQRNAYMVKAVIDWVNEEKVGNEQNVVLGMSMGGLVARYALRDMEINSETHDTELYISHDAPHQGANVPLAYQAMVRHLVGEQISLPVFFTLFDVDIMDLTDISPELEEGLDLLETPAAQQMLIYQLQGTGTNVSVDNSTLYSSFATEYQNMGYPQQGNIRNIAIANGSECGTQLNFNPYATLLNANETLDVNFILTNVAYGVLSGLSFNFNNLFLSSLTTSTDVKAEFNLKALPNQQSKQIYKGKIYIKKTILFFIDVEEQLIGEETVNSSASMLPLDNASGGVFDLESFSFEIPEEMEDYVLQTQFNFIPTFSSLDISEGSQPINYNDLTKVYSPLSPPLAPKNTPFHNFYTNPTTSESHIQFTLNNGNWLMAELRGEEGFYSCASSCSQLQLDITGPESVCTSETYNVGNLTSATEVNVQWSIMPVLAATLSTMGNSVTLTRNPAFSGYVTLTATINTECNDVTVEKQIWLGTPTVVAKLTTGEYISHGSFNTVCKQQQIKTNMTVNGETSVTWTLLSSSHTTTWSQQGKNVSFYLWAVNHTATFRFTTSNSCGTITRDYTFVSENCGGGGGDPCDLSMTYNIYPNPTSSSIEIDPSNPVPNIPAPCDPPMLKSANQNGKFKGTPTIATLYDFNGNNVKTQIPAQGTMNVESLKAGHYILVIQDGDKSESHHIIIE